MAILRALRRRLRGLFHRHEWVLVIGPHGALHLHCPSCNAETCGFQFTATTTTHWPPRSGGPRVPER